MRCEFDTCWTRPAMRGHSQPRRAERISTRIGSLRWASSNRSRSLVEVIGEAANKVSEDAKQTLPGVPWRQIIAMRNRLTHGYYDIDLDRVWDTVTDDLPPLIVALETALSPESGED